MWGSKRVMIQLAKLGVQYFDGLQAVNQLWDNIK